jgi:methyl-accepting chemotaxis protein
MVGGAMRVMNEHIGNFSTEMQLVTNRLHELAQTAEQSQGRVDGMIASTEELYERMRLVDKELEAIIALEK